MDLTRASICARHWPDLKSLGSLPPMESRSTLSLASVGALHHNPCFVRKLMTRCPDSHHFNDTRRRVEQP